MLAVLLVAVCAATAARAATTAAAAPVATGYWMLGTNGTVYAFGSAPRLGSASVTDATHLEPTPTDKGYWIVNAEGRVFSFGDAVWRGNATGIRPGERVTSLSSTFSGNGYWMFTSLGRVLPFGDARPYGDMSGTVLKGSIIGSAVTPSGHGYYMVGTDGGIFSFGDARFHGSMGAVHINRPVNGLVPTADDRGYWLVASDGGIFAFGDAAFRGSMGNVHLNQPVIGMVRYGDGYLMVARDGGIFDFSDQPFLGSLADAPLAAPIIGVAPVPVAGAPAAVNDLSVVAGNTAVTATFTLPASQGAVIGEVKFRATSGSGSITGAWTSPGTSGRRVSEAIKGLVNGTSYSVTVSACNEAGKCGPDSNAATANPFGPPKPPSVSATQNGNSIDYSWTGGGNNGRPVADYHVCIDGSCTERGSNPGSTMLAYGCDSSHSIYAYVTDSVGQNSGNSATSTVSIQACPPPGAPSAGASASGSSITWSWSGGGGSGLPIGNYELCVDGGCSNVGASPGSTTRGYGCGETHSAYVYVVDTVGQQSGNSNTVDATTTCPPPQTVTISWGAKAPPSGCQGDQSCTYLLISWSVFSSGNHTLRALFDGGAFNPSHPTVTVSGSSGSFNNVYYAGYCEQSHVIQVTIDGVASNSINTNQHGC